MAIKAIKSFNAGFIVKSFSFLIVDITNIVFIHKTKNIFIIFFILYICIMETKKRGRKPKPAHLKVQMVSAYLTREQKELIVKEFGSVTDAIKSEILSQLYAKYATKKSEFGQWI